MQTMIIALVFAAAVAIAAVRIVKDKKKGNHCAGCNGCSNQEKCDIK